MTCCTVLKGKHFCVPKQHLFTIVKYLLFENEVPYARPKKDNCVKSEAAMNPRHPKASGEGHGGS